jgi:hypothetical protein
VAIEADVYFLQESWRSDTVDLAELIARRTGGTATTVPLAAGARVTGNLGGASWMPFGSLWRGNQGLYLDSLLPIGERAAQLRDASHGVEDGEWCIAVVTRLPVRSSEVIELDHLKRDRARRALLVCDLATPDGPLRAFALHGAHLSHGSLRQYRGLVTHLDERLDDGAAAVLGGDLNCWGPIARRVLRGWRQAARGPTWPSWRPHSQVDHLFVRGPIAVLDGGVLDRRGSDHRPVVATVQLTG